jgi:hypothetical protein
MSGALKESISTETESSITQTISNSTALMPETDNHAIMNARDRMPIVLQKRETETKGFR